MLFKCSRSLALSIEILCLVPAAVTAQPLISSEGNGSVWGIVNAGSFAIQGMPNAPVAEGSIFAIFGTGLGPATPVHATSFPLGTSLGGVSIAVSQGALAPVAAIPVYVSATQIDAIMPSNTPLGANTVTVTFDGKSSSASCPTCPSPSVQVIPAGFGIFSVNHSGGGQGSLTNRNNQPVSYSSPAAAGEVLNLWGTGLGAIGNDTLPPAAGDIGPNTVMVYVGGVEVPTLYHGRSPCCSGVDQIQFVVPPKIVGCSVPVAVRIGEGPASNFVSIAIAPNGGLCSNPDGIDGADLASAAASGFVSSGYINLSHSLSSSGVVDSGYASFEKYPYSDFDLTQQVPLQMPNLGACSVFAYDLTNSSNSYVNAPTPNVNPAPGAGLDAGPSITIAGPNGQKQITPANPGGAYTATLASDSNPGDYYYGSSSLFLSPGSYTISSQGGSGVGPFHVSVQMPPPVTWTIQGDDAGIVTRVDGATVEWTGADPNSYIIISGTSASQNITYNSADATMGYFGGAAGFNCTAKGSDGEFTIPPIVLSALPASGLLYYNSSVGAPEGLLQVSSIAPPVKFSARGLNLAEAGASTLVSATVTYR